MQKLKRTLTNTVTLWLYPRSYMYNRKDDPAVLLFQKCFAYQENYHLKNPFGHPV